MFPFLGLLLPPDDFDVHEVKETRKLFPSLVFPTRSFVFDEIIPKEEIFPSRENEFWCVRVCSRRTQSDRDLLLLFVRALYTARSTKVEVWTYLCACKSTKTVCVRVWVF